MKYPKKEKLKSKKLIEQLFTEGKSLSSFPLKLFYLKIDTPVDSQFKTGVAVPKRNFKKAVHRIRVKRLLRESYRLNKHLIFNNSEGNYALLFLYIGKEMPSLKELEKRMQLILQNFLKKTNNAKVD